MRLSDRDMVFQSTHPCGVRPRRERTMGGKVEFQSTHPCGVRHECLKEVGAIRVVSIHAPLRGATVCGGF